MSAICFSSGRHVRTTSALLTHFRLVPNALQRQFSFFTLPHFFSVVHEFRFILFFCEEPFVFLAFQRHCLVFSILLFFLPTILLLVATFLKSKLPHLAHFMSTFIFKRVVLFAIFPPHFFFFSRRSLFIFWPCHVLLRPLLGFLHRKAQSRLHAVFPPSYFVL